MKHFASLKLLLFLCLAPFVNASPRFLCCDYNGGKVAIVSSEGAIEWEYPCKAPQDCWKLDNGNILFCFATGALEVTMEKKIVWEYKAPEKTEVHSCQPIEDGKVLIVECGTRRLIEVGRDGKISKEIKLAPSAAVTLHDQFRGARKTPEGHYIVCFKGDHKVVEFTNDGKVLKEISVPGDVHAAVQLPDNHLLVTCGDAHKVVELDQNDKVVWELNENDVPENPLRLMAGCERLPNGNTIFCNYLGHGHVGRQPMCFELTPDKKVVWSNQDHAHFKTINQIHVLDLKEKTFR